MRYFELQFQPGQLSIIQSKQNIMKQMFFCTVQMLPDKDDVWHLLTKRVQHSPLGQDSPIRSQSNIYEERRGWRDCMQKCARSLIHYFFSLLSVYIIQCSDVVLIIDIASVASKTCSCSDVSKLSIFFSAKLLPKLTPQVPISAIPHV